MKALIFAAGLGTRLQPFTQSIPKALVRLHGKPLLQILIEKLIQSDINDIVINVHHFADQVIDFVKSNNNFGINIQFSDERDELLDTGGGLKKASWFFDDGQPFLVHNVDVISDIDVKDVFNEHLKSDAIATVAVRKRETSRYLLFDENKTLCGWENVSTGEKIISKSSRVKLQYGFSGIHVINPDIFDHIHQEGKFSIIETYLELAKSHRISAYDHTESIWIDLGKPENLKQAEKIFGKII